MEQPVKRMIDRLFFAAFAVVSVKMKRQSGDRLGENPHAGIHRRHLHGGAFRHRLPGSAAPEEEPEAAAGRGVLGLVTRLEDAGQDVQFTLYSFQFLVWCPPFAGSPTQTKSPACRRPIR